MLPNIKINNYDCKKIKEYKCICLITTKCTLRYSIKLKSQKP